MRGAKDSVPLVAAYLSIVLVGCAWSWKGACLQDGRHKPEPGREPHLRGCKLYKQNSCCSQEHIEDISDSAATAVGNESWDLCGSLSPSCQDFLKRVACFHRCSPDAILWAHPHRPDDLLATPLCHSFCTEWFEACKNDRTCARNWTTGWAGVNCTEPCVPFHELYKDGRGLCDRLWGDAFVATEDPEDKGEGGPRCLTLRPSDRAVINRLKPTAPPQSRRGSEKAAANKRSVAKRDAEGSGSGC